MLRRFSTNFALVSMLLDGLCAALALWTAVTLRWAGNTLPFLRPLQEPTRLPAVLWVVFPVAWVVILLILSIYDSRKNFRASDEFGSLTLAALLAGVSLAGILFLSYREVSRALFLLFILLGFLYQAGWRAAVRLVFWRSALGRAARRRVLIAGAGEIARTVEAQIRAQPYRGICLVGLLDDDPEARKGPNVLGGLDELRRLVQEEKVDDVVIAFPRSAHRRLNRLVAELHDLPVKVWIIPDYFSLALHRATVEDFAGIPMLDLRAPALDDYQRLVKRAFDLTVTVLAAPLVVPVGLLAALAIRLDSPGPVFFRQKRVGENGRLFEMVKFRTMVQNAEQLRHLVETVQPDGRVVQNKRGDDPRVTRVGRFLRRTSLDELPQLINVVRGDMSLIGPRPELPYLVEKYELWQRKRFAVPQGMTGWWQVNGRSDKPMHLHTEEDLYYVQHYSILLDLQILLKTLWVVLRGKGAY